MPPGFDDQENNYPRRSRGGGRRGRFENPSEENTRGGGGGGGFKGGDNYDEYPNAKPNHRQSNNSIGSGGAAGGRYDRRDRRRGQQNPFNDEGDDFDNRQPQRNNQNEDNSPFRKNSDPVDIDNQVIPALANRNKKSNFDIPENEMDDQEVNNNAVGYMNAEDIHPKQMEIAGPLMPFLSEEICRGLFSKNWSYREGAVNAIGDELNRGARSELLNFNDEPGLFSAVLGAVSVSIFDKISKVGDASMQLIDILLKSMNPPAMSGSPEFNSYIDKILLGLVIKAGDSKIHIRNTAEDNLYGLAEFQGVGVRRVVDQLLKSYGVPKVVNDFKHTIARLNVLNRMAQDYGIDDRNVPRHETIAFAVKQLENSNNDVRDASHQLILTFMKALGSEAVSPLLQGNKVFRKCEKN